MVDANSVWWYVIANIASAIIGMTPIFWLLRGFLWPYLQVKMSRGKYVLVRVRGIARTYWRKGFVHESHLVYKSLSKRMKRLNGASPADLQDIWGVKVIYVDEASNAFINGEISKSATIKTGLDSENMDDLMTRCLMRPEDADKLKQMILLLLAINLLIGLGNMWFSYSAGVKATDWGKQCVDLITEKLTTL